MSKREDQKLAKLAKKNAERTIKPKAERRRQYDDTLRPEAETDQDLKTFFSDMKKREF